MCNCVAFAPPSPKAAAAACGGSGDKNNKPDSPAVPTLVAGYGDGTVRVFDVNTVEMQFKLHPHSVSVTAIAFSADGAWKLFLIIIIMGLRVPFLKWALGTYISYSS